MRGGLLPGIEDYIMGNGPWSVYLGERGRVDRPPEWDGNGIIARVENRSIARALAGMRVPVVDLSAARLLPRAPVVSTDNAEIARPWATDGGGLWTAGANWTAGVPNSFGVIATL